MAESHYRIPTVGPRTVVIFNLLKSRTVQERGRKIFMSTIKSRVSDIEGVVIVLYQASSAKGNTNG